MRPKYDIIFTPKRPFWQIYKEKIVMNTFKKILALLLALVFICTALIACKNDKKDDDKQDDGNKNN